MAKFFINRPIFAIVLALVISIAGMLCIFTLPVDRYPQIPVPIRRLWRRRWRKS